jgi:hypothetical protein
MTTTKAPATTTITNPVRPTVAQIVPGAVITYVKDVTFVKTLWADRAVGVHLLVTEAITSPGGYPFATVLNTVTGRRESIMLEEWVLDLLHLVPAR